MINPISQLAKKIVELGQPKRSEHWPLIRKKWLLNNGTCAACGSTQHLQVHHVIPFHLHPELELCETNFITLCETMGVEHHLKVGHTVDGKSSWKINNPDVRINAKQIYEKINPSIVNKS